jgi:hypothetical protein
MLLVIGKSPGLSSGVGLFGVVVHSVARSFIRSA